MLSYVNVWIGNTGATQHITVQKMGAKRFIKRQGDHGK
jgi:hypothetical protein